MALLQWLHWFLWLGHDLLGYCPKVSDTTRLDQNDRGRRRRCWRGSWIFNSPLKHKQCLKIRNVVVIQAHGVVPSYLSTHWKNVITDRPYYREYKHKWRIKEAIHLAITPVQTVNVSHRLAALSIHCQHSAYILLYLISSLRIMKAVFLLALLCALCAFAEGEKFVSLFKVSSMRHGLR